MTSVLGTILSYVLVYKYLGLFVITFLAAFALPLPSTTTLIAMSVFAATGYVSFIWTLVAGFLGNVGGDLLGYFLARKYGREIFNRLGLKKILVSPYLAKAEKYMVSHTGATIFFSRFITTIGPLVNVLSGLTKIPFRTYLPYEIIGEFFDTIIFALIGYYFGSQWENLGPTASLVELGVVVAVFCLYVLISTFWKRRRRLI